ncbi:transcription intermediary factor 1-alpha-like [Mytilus californianus]|uniref:transcription intermediary factor 1-alpha-like n=1 Tax=Mytilus californianus TaxID=6549 RepID=UPI002246D188|nr:transcription intermediary factor 1-alpha-like [Mytilus californianus]
MAESNSQQLTCPICLEVLKSPKILPCLHSFCQQCIHEIILSLIQNKEPKPKQFRCPICHTVVKPKDPTTNIEKWASLLQDNNAVGTAERQECHTCKHHNETSVAKFWCKNCIEAFCEKCNAMHGWVKLTSFHDVIPIEDANYTDSCIDLKVISEKCCLHPFTNIEAFCFDHEELCCLLCLTSSHRKCENVQAFSEMTETNRSNETLEEVLTKIKLQTEKLLEDKEKKTKRLNESAKTIEENAATFVQKIKCRLDDLFGNFIKQLRIITEEQESNPQTDITFLRDFIRTLGHWIEVTEVVRKFGTETQLFIHSKTMNGQIKENISQLAIRLSPDVDISLSFNENNILTQVATELLDIGKTTVKAIPSEARTKELFNLCRETGIKPPVDFSSMSVRKERNILIKDADITCGVFIDDNHIIVGADFKKKRDRRLIYVNTKTGDVINTTVLAGGSPSFKCLCFDKKSSHIFIATSSSYGPIMMAGVNEHFIEKPRTLSFRNMAPLTRVGVMAVCDDHLCVIANERIQKFKLPIQPTAKEHVTVCLENNTFKIPMSSGLAIRHGKWFYTSSGREVKCLTCQGNELFSYQSYALKYPGCLTITSSGVVLVVNQAENGSLHAISPNGKEQKLLLRKFDTIIAKIPIIMSVWTDDREETMCVCGGQYIEVYKMYSE